MALKLTGVILILFVFLFPWEEWLPGSAVYRYEASFLVRHAALISFLSFLVAVVTLFLWIVGVGSKNTNELKTRARAVARVLSSFVFLDPTGFPMVETWQPGKPFTGAHHKH